MKGDENSKKMSRSGDQFLKRLQGESGGQEKDKKLYGWWVFFILIYSILAIMITDTALGKFSLENLFAKVVVPGTSKHWSYYRVLLVCYLKSRLSSVWVYLT